LFKYRAFSANEERGNYILSFFAGFTLPTGSKNNTTDHASFTPTIAFGKGWGDFDLQATLGASVPDNAVGNLGTPILANAAFQYRLWQVFWPELEVNYTYWPNGERQGIHQVFITSGLVVGRIPIWQRMGLAVGAGFQIAVTERCTTTARFSRYGFRSRESPHSAVARSPPSATGFCPWAGTAGGTADSPLGEAAPRG